ncbi:MAG: DUF4290 domain-containing protein [Chitinophagaceae bacterium]
MEYNAAREHLIMREYGRHVQKMVDHILTIEDKVSQQAQAEGVVELMAFLNPQLKTIEDYKHKLWDHLFVISDFQLDVESPYGKPERATYKTKPDPLSYPKRKPRYNHLGKNLELVINKAMAEENAEKKSGFAHVIAHYMKLAYSNWHKELVHDDGIRQELNSITNGELEFSNTPFVRHRAPSFNETEGYGYAKKNNNRNFRNNNNRNNSNRTEGRGGAANSSGQFNRNSGNGNGNVAGNTQQAGSRPNNPNNKFNKKKRFQ